MGDTAFQSGTDRSADGPIENRLDQTGLFSTARDAWQHRFLQVSPADVERVLNEPPGHFRLERLAVLLSPAARAYLEPMARQARHLTRQRFGRTVNLYAPLYLSNYCNNDCTYCGFSSANLIRRRRLTLAEVLRDAEPLRRDGLTDLLLVSGEDHRHITVEFLAALAEALRPQWHSLSLEVQQLRPQDYRVLCTAGIDGVSFYQETYDPVTYRRTHLAGPKADYARRLRGPDEMAAAGVRRLGLAVLLGLSPLWRHDVLALALHADSLRRRHWQTHLSFSFPRLRPTSQDRDLQGARVVSDRDFVQLALALRLCFADVGMTLSTREAAPLRDALVPLAFTQISAGSRTNPGGYGVEPTTLEQFAVSDRRSAHQVAQALRRLGLEPVFKNWDRQLMGPATVTSVRS